MAIFNISLLVPSHGQSHTIFQGFISISGGWKGSCKELIVAEDSPHVTVQP